MSRPLRVHNEDETLARHPGGAGRRKVPRMSHSRLFVHDMKNHLGIIIGYSNLLLEELPLEDSHRADIDEIRKAGEAALALIERWRTAPVEDDAKGEG
jgi:hypothetical protein